ncbi:hypothetical protein B0T10DRAFT_76159 [Thelonectria olida]|uniref:Uncharacterized protein n=1 Tax=Thelonectria olida TaxID=1576542 RepID=A0A9P8W3R2_9HYPO|nr:hypothetical protein B0T10DRAFT_76159 [Thelonectria olida]
MAQEAASAGRTKSLVNDIGVNLVEAVQALSQLTDALVESPRIHQAVLEAHEESRAKTDLCDLSTIVSMDIDHSKLRKIQDLTSQFSRDVHDIWQNGTARGRVQTRQ